MPGRQQRFYPGKAYYVVGFGHPDKRQDGDPVHFHWWESPTWGNVQFVFSTLKKAERFIGDELRLPETHFEVLDNQPDEPRPSDFGEGWFVAGYLGRHLLPLALEMGMDYLMVDPRKRAGDAEFRFETTCVLSLDGFRQAA